MPGRRTSVVYDAAGGSNGIEKQNSWVRTLPGSSQLRALIVFDEVYGFLPPHPANPPTKRPLVALMKQARAFGVGVLVADGRARARW